MNTNTHISELGLGTKAYRALRAFSVKTVGDFLALRLDSVLHIPGIGTGTFQSLAHARRRLESELGNASELSDDPVSNWNITFKQLSVRTKNGLAKLDINTLPAFQALTQEQFLSVRSIGTTCWMEVLRHQNRLRDMVSVADASLPGTTDAGSGRNHTHSLLAVRNTLATNRLLTMSHEEVVALKHVGAAAWAGLQCVIQRVSAIAMTDGATHDYEAIQLAEFPLFGGAGIGNTPIPESFYPDTPTDSLALAARCMATIETLHLNSLEAVLMAPPESLLNQDNFGETSLVALRQSVLDYLKYRNTSDDSPADMGESFSDFLQILCKSSDQPKKHTDILLGRLGGVSGETSTYDALALEHDYSKERIRQIINTTVGSIEQHYQSRRTLKSFRSELQKILDDFRGIIGLVEFCKQLSQRLLWTGNVSAESLRELFKAFSFGDGIEIEDGIVSCKHPCRTCRLIVERVRELMNSQPSETLSFSALCEPNSLCVPTPDRGCPTNVALKLSMRFLRDVVTRAGLCHDDDCIYSARAMALRQGGIKQKVEAIMDTRGRVASPCQVLEELLPYLDERVSKEKIHTAMIGANGVHVWGRGEYIHENHIHINRDTLSAIRDTLGERLANAPFVALYGVFEELRLICEEAGIPNDYALSTVVSLYIDDLHVDRYRYVFADRPSKAKSIDPYIEEWLLKQGDEVKRSDLERWMVEQIGVRKSLIHLSLGRLDDVFASRRGYLIHIENTGLDAEHLAPFCRQAMSALEQHDHIGVGKLFREQQVTCHQLGIVSDNMLYAVMRHFFSDVLEFNRYPHICLHRQDSFDTLGESIVEYIRDRNGLVAVDDYVGHFETKGYSPIQLRARISNLQQILPFYPGCVVHVETIGWDEEKASRLRETLIEAYSSRLDLGHLVGDLEEAYELYEEQLPALSANMSWTQNLLAALAAKCDDVILLGNAKRAYAMTSREEATTTLAELIVVVVRDHFGGGCSRDQMNQWMQDNGVVRKQLTPLMFTAPDGLEMNDYECLWKGGTDAGPIVP